MSEILAEPSLGEHAYYLQAGLFITKKPLGNKACIKANPTLDGLTFVT